MNLALGTSPRPTTSPLAIHCHHPPHSKEPTTITNASPLAAAAYPSRRNKLRLLPLIGATYFMVAGGPYGLEDIIGKAGYLRALILLAVIPFIWSLPTSLMVGELASAIPSEGGYYVWVRRALGPFWGFQEAWLSLAASVFDMAIYPTIFVLYLSRIAPSLTSGIRGTLWALAVILACTLWNLRGASAVGISSVFLFCALLSPFVVLIAAAVFRWHGHGTGAITHLLAAPDLAGAVSVTLWNYMGWDNASTVAQEVDNPQRNYPRAMLASAALVAITYILPLAAVGLAGLAPEQFSTGAWTDAARNLGGTLLGPALALSVVIGGMINGAGMFNPLMMSYTRVPFAMAQDSIQNSAIKNSAIQNSIIQGLAHASLAAGRKPNLLARAFALQNRAGVPWFSVIFCALIWALALGFTLERLISIDLVLYGAALILEFIALAVLRHREPNLPRPFRVPGGLPGTIAAGIGPTCLILFALYAARNERVLGLPALLFAALVAFTGAAVYAFTTLLQPPTSKSASTQ